MLRYYVLLPLTFEITTNATKSMYRIVGIILSSFAVQILTTEECVTPNNEKAECISLYACPALTASLATQQEGSAEFVRKSNCGGTASNPMVCCGSSGNFAKEEKGAANKNSRNDTQKINLLPTRRFCGYQHSDDYFHTTNFTSAITEFPWLAMIVFKSTDPDDNTPSSICGGSLINTRYVLTAAHCIYYSRRYGKSVAVHLGEYHINNKTDCVQEPPFEQECSDAIQIFDIENAIPHPKYSSRNKSNDIALLRLNRTISYSDYIRPICLPLPGTTLANVGDILTSSGWGTVKISGAFVDIKKKSLSTLLEIETCAMAYADLKININENNLCAAVANNSPNTECQGDSGGPLLFSHQNQWHQEGIISFGKSCGVGDPGLYTKVVNYLDWILESIEK